MLLKELGIKNIIWDVDGTLVDINHSYYCFIKNHPKIKKFFKNFLYKDLPKALPIDPKYGAIELKTHKTLGTELDKLFCNSKYYFDRPFYYGTEKTLNKLNKLGYKQFILSAGFNIKKKEKLLKQLFSNFPFIKIEVVQHDKKGMHEGDTKKQKILDLLKKYNLSAKETVLIDDRLYNIHAGIKTGIKVIRFRSEFTTPTTGFTKKIKEIEDIRELIS